MALGGALKSVLTRFDFSFDKGQLGAVNATTNATVRNLSMATKKAAILRDRMQGVMRGVVGIAGALVGGAVVHNLTVGFARGADEVARMSKSLGVSTEFFTAFRYGLESIGIEGSETSQLIADVSERMFDAAEGSKALADDFAQIGFSKAQLKELHKKGPEAQIMALADAMQKTGPGAKRTFAAMSGLGDVGARLLPLLEGGSKGLKKVMADAKRFGVVMDKDAVEKARRFNRQLFHLKARVNGFRNAIALKLLPALTATIDHFQRWITEGYRAHVMLGVLGAAAAVATVLIGKIVSAFVVAQWGAFVMTIRKAIFALSQMNLAMLPSAIAMGVLIAGFAAILLLVEDLYYFSQGDKSITGELFGRDKEILAGLKAISASYEHIVFTLSVAWEKLWKSIVKLGAAFGIKLTTVSNLLKQIGLFLLKGVLLVLVAIGNVLGFIAGIFASLIALAARFAAGLIEFLTPAVDEIREKFLSLVNWLAPVFNWLAKAARWTGKQLSRAFVWAAEQIIKAWHAVGNAIDAAGAKAVSVATKLKNIAFRRTEEAFGGLQSPAAALSAALGRRPGGGTNNQVNVGGVTVNAAPGQSPREIANEVSRRIVNDAYRELTPSGSTSTGTGAGGSGPTIFD